MGCGVRWATEVSCGPVVTLTNTTSFRRSRSPRWSWAAASGSEAASADILPPGFFEEPLLLGVRGRPGAAPHCKPRRASAAFRPWGGRRGPARRRARPRGRGSPFAGAEPFAEAGLGAAPPRRGRRRCYGPRKRRRGPVGSWAVGTARYFGRGGLEAGVTGKKGFPRLYKKRICMER